MDAKRMTRLRNLANQIRAMNRPAKINAQDFVELVSESGTQEAGLCQAAEKCRKLRTPVYVESQVLVTLIDSLIDEQGLPQTQNSSPFQLAELPEDWSPPGSPEV